MRKRRIAGIVLGTFGSLLVAVLFMQLYAIMHQAKEDTLPVREGQEESETAAENGWIENSEDAAPAVCETVRAMDFTAEQPHMELTEEEDLAYKKAFLSLLKNELPIEGGEGWCEDGDRYRDLWWSGVPYEELLKERDNTDFGQGCCYYYDDIDGDGKPEFGVRQGAVYFFDYELGEEACSVSYGGQRTYFEGLLGVGKIWEHDTQHAWVERFRYVVLNGEGEWEEVLQLELYYDEEEETVYTKNFLINGVDVGEENWKELTAPFFEAAECEIPKKTLAEVFGELLETEKCEAVAPEQSNIAAEEQASEEMPGGLYVDFSDIEENHEILERAVCTEPRYDWEDTPLGGVEDLRKVEEEVRKFEEYINSSGERVEGRIYKLRTDIHYFLFDFNDDGLEDYVVCNNSDGYVGSAGQSVEIYIQEEGGTVKEVLAIHDRLHLSDDIHARVAVLNEKTDGYYAIVLPSNHILRYDSNTDRYEFHEGDKSDGSQQPMTANRTDEFIRNPYFYDKDEVFLQAKAKYFDGYFGGGLVEKNVYIRVDMLQTYEEGSVYKFTVDMDDDVDERDFYRDQGWLDHYFYVTKDRIYSVTSAANLPDMVFDLNDNADILTQIYDTDEKLIEWGTIVCQEEEMMEDRESVYRSITKTGNQVTHYAYSIKANGEIGWSMYYTWKEGAGLVSCGFRRGPGEGYDLILDEIEELTVAG